MTYKNIRIRNKELSMNILKIINIRDSILSDGQKVGTKDAVNLDLKINANRR
jgi:hypothetical protein